MTVKINSEVFILWRAVDSEGYELDVLLQRRRNQKSAIRFLARLLGSDPVPRVIITDKQKVILSQLNICVLRRIIVLTRG